LVRDRRLEAGLSQAELARRVGTTQSAISRLESADYTGHSLSALRRIAAVLGCKVLVDIVPMTDTHKRPTAGSVAATHR
jgi:transcriptional regulator with XRE-family HTH domain